jgi:hypothetical protein
MAILRKHNAVMRRDANKREHSAAMQFLRSFIALVELAYTNIQILDSMRAWYS